MAKAGDTNRIGYKELKAELRKGENRALYVLYGEESFLIDKLVGSIRELILTPGSESFDSVTFSGTAASRLSLDRLRSELMTPPFLSRCKMIVIRGCGYFAAAEKKSSDTAEPESDGATADAKATKGRQQELIQLIEQLPDSVCLVFVEEKVDRRQKALIQVIEKKGVLAEIGQEQPALLRQWVEVEARQRGFAIEALAAESLVDRCDNSMQVLWQEMNKIFLYLSYAGLKHIDRALVEQLSLPDLRGNIFDMTDAISRGQTSRALELLDLLLGQKEPVQLISFMLARHFRQLICAKDLGRSDALVRELKVMPFVANRLLQQAKLMPIEQMEQIYGLCFETDLAVKTGQLPERTALEMLLVTAASAAKSA
ncbi:MAG: DNA polymerase III subunit delta [Clostridia bacterium]|nr:DNA polymerase III subunit delta [Clostridia bacterium]